MKVQMTLTSAQMSPAGERAEYLAPLCRLFDAVCQVAASATVLEAL